MTRKMLVTAMAFGVSVIAMASHRELTASPMAACSVRGVWDMDSLLVNGMAQSRTGSHQRVINTAKHFMWLAEAKRRDTLPLKTYRDTVAFYNISGGSGTYTVSGTHLVQHIDYFVDPTWMGRNFNAVCRTQGKRWYHTWYTDPRPDSATHQMRRDTVTEIYLRVE